MTRSVEAVVPYLTGDVLIWTSSVSGELSFKDAYDVCHYYKWLACIIPPRRSNLVYRACFEKSLAY